MNPGHHTHHTLTVHSPAIPQHLGRPALEPVRLSGREGVNALFEYQLLLKTPDSLNLLASHAADWDLDSFIGREISCSIELDGLGQFVAGAVGASVDHIGQGTRQINALITEAALWGEEGRHLQYKLTLRPWLHLATLSTDCKIFQNKTVVQVLDELLADYPFAVDKRLIETYPVRDYQTQFNETDFAFFSRLCQEWGISYFFEHSEGKHRLVLIDSMGAYKKSDSLAYQQIEYHPPGWKLDAEYIHSFVPHHQLTSGRYATSDYDYTRPRANLAVSRSDPRPTGHATGAAVSEVYQWHDRAAGSHYAQPQAGSASANDPQDEGRNFALLRLQALRTHGARAQASGNLRAIVPGCRFTLQQHPQQKANTEYLILETQFLIENVAQDSQIKGAAPNRKQQWKVEVDFTAHPMAEPLRPALSQGKPHTGGPQVARVVGPEGENVWTDALGRIKVQFPWDRLGQHNQHSTCWLRVSSQWAGNQLGAMHLPRIGQEVIVDFLGGDADLPICTGRVNNQNNLPPWALPSQSALSGFRSRELTKEGGNSAAGRSNHLILDDTAQQIQAQLKSDHQSSSLSLGHITRIEDNAGRKDARGEGFELRSDGHGVLRAQAGLLITTQGRSNAAGHAKAMQETTARLKLAQQQHQSLGEAASTASAQLRSPDEDQASVAQAIKSQNKAIEGQTSTSNSPVAQSINAPLAIHSGANTAAADKRSDSFLELSEAHLLLASQAGIAATTAGSLHLQAGEHIALTSEGHTSLSTAKRLLVSAKEGLRLFALNSGMKFIAGNDRVQIEAHKDKVNLTARQALRITSSNDEIHFIANKVVFNGGGSFTEWSGAGITHGTQGSWVEHAAGHGSQGPKSISGSAVKLPEVVCIPCLLKAARAGSAISRF